MEVKMKHPKYELKKSRCGKFFFSLTANNGRVIASSDIFYCKESALAGIQLIRDSIADAVIEDMTELQTKDA